MERDKRRQRLMKKLRRKNRKQVQTGGMKINEKKEKRKERVRGMIKKR